MNHLIRKATLLAIGALLVAGAANAGAPSSANSVKPVGLQLVETNGTGGPGPDAVDPLGNITFVIRDAVPNPIPNAQVKISFAGCPHIQLSSDLKRTDATIDCSAKTVTTTTNASGVAVFAIVGKYSGLGATFPDPDPVPGLYPGCATVTVTVPGFPPAIYPNLIASVYDLNGGSGVDGGDLSLALGDRFGGNYAEKSDFDVTGTPGAVTGGDLSVALGARFGGGSTVTGANFCP
jgi:hypothetical protein